LIFRYDEPTNTAGDIDSINYHQEARNVHDEPAHPGGPIKTEVIERSSALRSPASTCRKRRIF
jgi:hypothetical protein